MRAAIPHSRRQPAQQPRTGLGTRKYPIKAKTDELSPQADDLDLNLARKPDEDTHSDHATIATRGACILPARQGELERFQRRLSLSSAIYYDVWKGIQTDQFLASGIPFTTNAGDAHVLGLEAEINFRADDGFFARLNGRVSRTRTTNANLEFITVLAHDLPGAPPISGGALIGYERPVFGDLTMRLVGQAIYVGLSRVSFDALLPRTGGFTQTRVLAEISRQGLGAQVFVTNALDSFRDTFSFGNPFTAAQARQITPQRPITVGATLFASF